MFFLLLKVGHLSLWLYGFIGCGMLPFMESQGRTILFYGQVFLYRMLGNNDALCAGYLADIKYVCSQYDICNYGGWISQELRQEEKIHLVFQ